MAGGRTGSRRRLCMLPTRWLLYYAYAHLRVGLYVRYEAGRRSQLSLTRPSCPLCKLERSLAIAYTNGHSVYSYGLQGLNRMVARYIGALSSHAVLGPILKAPIVESRRRRRRRRRPVRPKPRRRSGDGRRSRRTASRLYTRRAVPGCATPPTRRRTPGRRRDTTPSQLLVRQPPRRAAPLKCQRTRR